MTPGPLLAAIVDTVTGQDGAGLAGCSDDQLVGIISAARRMQSRCAWTEMAAMTEFATRHAGGNPEDEFAADELASELHLTPLSAAEQMHYSSTANLILGRCRYRWADFALGLVILAGLVWLFYLGLTYQP